MTISNNTAYIVEVGVLLPPDDPEYDKYNLVYDKKHGFYDENQYYCLSKDKAIAEAIDYITKGNDTTYGIVSQTTLPDSLISELKSNENIEIDLDGLSYNLSDVIFAAAKKNDKIIQLFDNIPYCEK